MALVTPEQLFVHMRRDADLDRKDAAAAELIIAGLEGSLRLWLGRDLEAVEHVERFAIDGERELHLSHLPVVEVSEVRVSETEVLDPSYYVVHEWGLDLVLLFLPTTSTPWFEVHYTAGVLEESDPHVYAAARLAVLQASARMMHQRGDDVQGLRTLSQEGQSETFITEWLTDDELRPLEPLRRR